MPAPLLGTENSRDGTFCWSLRHRNQYKVDSTKDDVPTWANLLGDLHDFRYQAPAHGTIGHALIERRSDNWSPVCISRRTRSWDFMPPDIVRPIASTTIGCLVTMAHRLGMTWQESRFDEGTVRTVGGGRSFSTSIVRGMGWVVEYSTAISIYTPHYGQRCIPSQEVDQMACGVVPTISSPAGLRLIDKKDLAVSNLMSVIRLCMNIR